jgi:hypothetical protein
MSRTVPMGCGGCDRCLARLLPSTRANGCGQSAKLCHGQRAGVVLKSGGGLIRHAALVDSTSLTHRVESSEGPVRQRLFCERARVAVSFTRLSGW